MLSETADFLRAGYPPLPPPSRSQRTMAVRISAPQEWLRCPVLADWNKTNVMGLRTLNPWESTEAPARTVEPASYAVFCSYGLLLRWIVVNLIKFATMRTMDRRFQTRSLAMYARDETALVGEESKTAQNFHFTESCSNAYKDSCKAYVKWLILMTTEIFQKHLYGYSSCDFNLFFAKHPRTSIRCCGDRVNK